jgi:hypothetical protein
MKAVPVNPEKEALVQRVAKLTQDLGEAKTRPVATDQERVLQRADVMRLTEDLALAKRQKDYKTRGAFRNFMYDILGDNGNISFHRFQIAVWTLVLGIVFVMHVLGELAMPEFSATILGLMGISSGTYLGFKLPAVSAPGKT